MIRVARFSALVLCVVAFLGAAQRLPSPAPAPSTAPGPPADNKDWFEPTEPQRIVGPIYYVGTWGWAPT